MLGLLPGMGSVRIRLHGKVTNGNSVTIHHLNGQTVLHETLEESQNLLDIDLVQHRIEKGGYVVLIKTDHQVITKKLIVF